MNNCIFTAHCMESFCDNSCPMLSETSYLLERNDIPINSWVFTADANLISTANNIIDAAADTLLVYPVSGKLDTSRWSELVTYCAICKEWHGSQLHCTVYNLKLSKYLETVKQSWGTKSDGDGLDYIRIWIESCNILIISNFDYVDFRDFESQTLLNILQDRRSRNKTTILISPPINSLVSTKPSLFFNTLKSKLSESVRTVK